MKGNNKQTWTIHKSLKLFHTISHLYWTGNNNTAWCTFMNNADTELCNTNATYLQYVSNTKKNIVQAITQIIKNIW